MQSSRARHRLRSLARQDTDWSRCIWVEWQQSEAASRLLQLKWAARILLWSLLQAPATQTNTDSKRAAWGHMLAASDRKQAQLVDAHWQAVVSVVVGKHCRR